MGKFVEVVILISRDNISVLSTKAQMFQVKISFGMDGKIREGQSQARGNG